MNSREKNNSLEAYFFIISGSVKRIKMWMGPWFTRAMIAAILSLAITSGETISTRVVQNIRGETVQLGQLYTAHKDQLLSMFLYSKKKTEEILYTQKAGRYDVKYVHDNNLLDR